MSNYNFNDIANDKILNFYKFLLIIFPISIVAGNFISNGIVILSLPIIFYLFLNKLNQNIFFDKEIKLVFFLFLYLIISSLISQNIYSIEYSLRYLRFFSFILIIYYFLKIDEKFEKKFLKLFNILFFILLIDGFFQYLNGSNFLGIQKIVDHRISGFFGDELILGSFISKYIFVFFVYFFLIKKNKLILLIFLISLIALTYLSGERVAFFSIMIFSVLAMLKFAKLKEIIIFFSILFSILMMITLKDSTTRERMINETIKQTQFLKEWRSPKKIILYSDAHNSHYQSAYLMYKKGNFLEKLFGRGFKSFRINCSKQKFCDTPGGCCSTHPHNVFFQIISETGLIGFAIYMYFILNLFRNIIGFYLGKIYKPKFFLVNLALFVNFLPIIPSGNLFGSFMSFNFAILISFYMYFQKNE